MCILALAITQERGLEGMDLQQSLGYLSPLAIPAARIRLREEMKIPCAKSWASGRVKMKLQFRRELSAVSFGK